MEKNYFEQQLFNWTDWDDHGPGEFQFTGCTLKKDFHDFKAGHEFDWAYISLQNSILEFGNKDGEKIYTFDLVLDTTTTVERH
jgi:hypothetical protein